jgi:hypothetical protein
VVVGKGVFPQINFRGWGMISLHVGISMTHSKFIGTFPNQKSDPWRTFNFAPMILTMTMMEPLMTWSRAENMLRGENSSNSPLGNAMCWQEEFFYMRVLMLRSKYYIYMGMVHNNLYSHHSRYLKLKTGYLTTP